MLLLVSIVFLLFNTPSHLIRVYIFVKKLYDSNYQPDYSLWVAQNYTMHLFYANFASNFALYNASGTTFRRAMIRLGRRFLVRIRVCCSASSVKNDRSCKPAQCPNNVRRSLYAAGERDSLRPSTLMVNNVHGTPAQYSGVADQTSNQAEATFNGKSVPTAINISLSRIKIFGSTSADNLGAFGNSVQKTSEEIPMLPCQLAVTAVMESESSTM